MATLNIQHIDKIYDNNVQAVFDFNLDVKDGELIVLVGPSGCGKSTTLRMVAGLEDISAGKLLLDGKDITAAPAKDRDMAMVFQSYALYGHMTIYENMAFSLTLRKENPNVIHKKVLAAAEILGLTSQLNKKPAQLSGGQRQRVAMGRSIVRNPKVFLFDEPLSNLDAKLRVEMRTVIKNIQKNVGITTVYVTHDQEEAMAVSDRIAVMKDGVIRHCGRPQNIYQRPADLFVATFIGKSNLLKAKLKREQGQTKVIFGNGYTAEFKNILPEAKEGDVVVSARPEELLIHKEKVENSMKAVVQDSVFLGLNTHYFVKLETNEDAEIIQESDVEEIIRPGSEIWLTLNEKKANVFDNETSLSIMKGVESFVELPKDGAREEAE